MLKEKYKKLTNWTSSKLNFWPCKSHVKGGIKRQGPHMEKTVANHTPNKELVSQICKGPANATVNRTQTVQL